MGVPTPLTWKLWWQSRMRASDQRKFSSACRMEIVVHQFVAHVRNSANVTQIIDQTISITKEFSNQAGVLVHIFSTAFGLEIRS